MSRYLKMFQIHIKNRYKKRNCSTLLKNWVKAYLTFLVDFKARIGFKVKSRKNTNSKNHV